MAKLPLSGWQILAALITVSVLAPAVVHVQSPAGPGVFSVVTDAMLQDPAPEDWLMWRRTLDGWAYSPLDQITRDNVVDLRMVWTRAMIPGAQEGTPLVYNGVLYMSTFQLAYAQVVYGMII